MEEALATAANLVYIGTIKNASELKDKLSDTVPGDRQFQDAFKTAKVSNQRLARYYLRSLEMRAKGEREPWFVPQEDHVIINLEHVLPRKPGGNWPSFKAEEASAYVSRLGNLVLLRASNNTGLGNNTFPAKRPTYAASPYILTNMIAKGNWSGISCPSPA